MNDYWRWSDAPKAKTKTVPRPHSVPPAARVSPHPKKAVGEKTKLRFCGAFGTRAAAVAKQKEVGGDLRLSKVRGKVRYVVMSRA